MSISYTVSPTSVDFGKLIVGNASPPATITIFNTTTTSDVSLGSFILIGVQGGGSVIIGCGQLLGNGGQISLPAGYDISRAVAMVVPGEGTGADQLEGVYTASQAGSFINLAWQARSGAPSTNVINGNYTVLAWTADAAVTTSLDVSGGQNVIQVFFTTAAGDPLCFVCGAMPNGSTLSIPAGFALAQFQKWCGPQSTNHTGNGWQFIQTCDVDAGSGVASLIYNDNSGNTWNGSLTVFGLFWQTGGGITTSGITGGTGVIIPAAAGAGKVTVMFGILTSGASYTLPTDFTAPLGDTCSVIGNITPSGTDVAHGFSLNHLISQTYAGQYQDASGHSWDAIGSFMSVAAFLADSTFTVTALASLHGEFAVTGGPTLPADVAPGGTLSFQITCTAEFRGFNSYANAVQISTNAGTTLIAASYTGFLLTPAYTINPDNRQVLFGLSGVWNGNGARYATRSDYSISCEADCTLEKQYDFDAPSYIKYVNGVWVRTEPSGAFNLNLSDTTVISGQPNTVTVNRSNDGSLDSLGMVEWLWFDLENNGEIHLIKLVLPAGQGIGIVDGFAFKYEQRGTVYEGS